MTDDAGLKLTDSYRSARKLLLAVCAAGIAWSTAQIDSNALNVPTLGPVVLDSAAIPILFWTALLYGTCRLYLEYLMMPDSVRRWTLAQSDWQISAAAVRIALFAVAVGTENRSVMSVGRNIALALLSAIFIRLGPTKMVGMFFMAPRPLHNFWKRSRLGRENIKQDLAFVRIYAGLVMLIGIGSAILKFRISPFQSGQLERARDSASFVIGMCALASVYFDRTGPREKLLKL